MKFDAKTAAVTIAALFVLSRLEATRDLIAPITDSQRRFFR